MAATISESLGHLHDDLVAAYQKIEEKGGTMPEHKNSGNLAGSIESIAGGQVITAPNFATCSLTAGIGLYLPGKTVGIRSFFAKGLGTLPQSTGGPTAFPAGTHVAVIDYSNGDILYQEDNMKVAADLPIGYYMPLTRLVVYNCDENGNNITNEPEYLSFAAMIIDNAGTHMWRYRVVDKDGQQMCFSPDRYYKIKCAKTAIVCNDPTGFTGNSAYGFVNGFGLDASRVGYTGDFVSTDHTTISDAYANEIAIRLNCMERNQGWCTYTYQPKYTGSEIYLNDAVKAHIGIDDMLASNQLGIVMCFKPEIIAKIKSGYYNSIRVGSDIMSTSTKVEPSNPFSSSASASISISKGAAVNFDYSDPTSPYYINTAFHDFG